MRWEFKLKIVWRHYSNQCHVTFREFKFTQRNNSRLLCAADVWKSIKVLCCAGSYIREKRYWRLILGVCRLFTNFPLREKNGGQPLVSPTTYPHIHLIGRELVCCFICYSLFFLSFFFFFGCGYYRVGSCYCVISWLFVRLIFVQPTLCCRAERRDEWRRDKKHF